MLRQTFHSFGKNITESKSPQPNIHNAEESTTPQDTKRQGNIFNIFPEKNTIHSVITCMSELSGKDFSTAIIITVSGAKRNSTYLYKQNGSKAQR